MNDRTDREKLHISRVVKAICRERQWSQADFARHAGIGQDVVSAWVRQKVSPSIKMLYRVSNNLNENVDRFIAPTTPPPDPEKSIKPSEPSDPEMSLDFNRPGLAHIELSGDMPRDAAIKIAEIVNSVTSVRKGRAS